LTDATVVADFGGLAPGRLADYAVAVQAGKVLDDAVGQPSAGVWAAERYGGTGVGHNGGAGRCIGDGEVQVKGCGATPLVYIGDGTFWHSHGGLTLADAVYEALWSLVFEQALPLGTVRVLGILRSGEMCPFEPVRGKVGHAPGALLVREAAARPGHFMRSIYLRGDAHCTGVADVLRTANAVRSFPSTIRLVQPGPVEPALHWVAARFAIQSARAEARRLMHGSLGASNIALDGRWLDFGTATSAEDYRDTKSPDLPRVLPTFWQDHLGLCGALYDLGLYLNKYLDFPEAAHRPVMERVIDTFLQEHERASCLAFFELLGLGEPAAGEEDLALDLGLKMRQAAIGLSCRTHGMRTWSLLLRALALWEPGKGTLEAVPDIKGINDFVRAYMALRVMRFMSTPSSNTSRGERVRRVLAWAKATASLGSWSRHSLREWTDQFNRPGEKEAGDQAIRAGLLTAHNRARLLFSRDAGLDLTAAISPEGSVGFVSGAWQRTGQYPVSSPRIDGLIGADVLDEMLCPGAASALDIGALNEY
jgi:hypothetical protein